MDEFHFRHILKDGTILKPGEKFPDTPQRREAFGRVVELIHKIENRHDEKCQEGQAVSR